MFSDWSTEKFRMSCWLVHTVIIFRHFVLLTLQFRLLSSDRKVVPSLNFRCVVATTIIIVCDGIWWLWQCRLIFDILCQCSAPPPPSSSSVSSLSLFVCLFAVFGIASLSSSSSWGLQLFSLSPFPFYTFIMCCCCCCCCQIDSAADGQLVCVFIRSRNGGGGGHVPSVTLSSGNTTSSLLGELTVCFAGEMMITGN